MGTLEVYKKDLAGEYILILSIIGNGRSIVLESS